MLKLIVLGSGSAGNSALLCTGTSRLLIDAGLSATRLLERLALAGVEPDSLSGIFITHEHGDHCRGLDILTKKHPLPILCNARTREVLRDAMKGEKNWHIVPGAGAFEFAGLKLETFPVPHDAAEPVGLVVRHGEAALGVLSDVGHITPVMRQKLRSLDTLFIEANYDTALLSQDTKRPWSTKQRIQGRHGHLSNEQTAAFIAEMACARLERIVLGHLSRDCNTPDLAIAAIRAVLAARQLAEVEVHCAAAHEATPWFRVRTRPAPTPAPTPTPTAAPVVPPLPTLHAGPAAWHQMELL